MVKVDMILSSCTYQLCSICRAATNIVSPLSGWMASHVGVESVIAKFSRLKAKTTMAKNNEMEARAMIAELLHRERVAKRSTEKATVSFRMANA